MERCACCDRPLSPVARFGPWCQGCADTGLSALLRMRCGDVGAAVAFFQDADQPFLAKVVMGVIPFEREETQ